MIYVLKYFWKFLPQRVSYGLVVSTCVLQAGGNFFAPQISGKKEAGSSGQWSQTQNENKQKSYTTSVSHLQIEKILEGKYKVNKHA